MDTRALSLFLSLSETLHFGRTSDQHHISASALSRTIKQLEETLGVTLFERDNRKVILTPQGRLLQSYARETLQSWDTLRETLMQESQELQGAISIYCSVTASYSFLYDILSDFRQRHPRIELKLHTGDPAPAIQRVINGHEDIAIAARPDNLPSSVAFRRIAVSPLVFIAPTQAPYLDQKGDPDWSTVPMIVSEEGIGRDRVDAWFKGLGITPKIYAQVAGHEAMVSMVSLGFGIGVVPKIVLDNSPLADKVQILAQRTSEGNALGHYDVGLCTLEKRLKSPIIKAFWN